MVSLRLNFVVALLSFVWADVKFTSPAAGSSITGNTISIKWVESGVAPPIHELASYEIFLDAGGNSAANSIPLTTLVAEGDFGKGNSVSANFSTSLGGAQKDAYFLKMISATTGGVVINYSDRFTLLDMNGAFPSVVLNGLKTIDGTAGPPTENDIQTPKVGSALSSSSSSAIRATSTASPPKSSGALPSSTKGDISSPSTAVAQGISLSAGAGAGIAVGAICILAGCAFGIFYFVRSKKLRKTPKSPAVSRMLSFTGTKPQLEDTSMLAVLRREQESNINSYTLTADQQNRGLGSETAAMRYELEGESGAFLHLLATELPP